MTPVQAVFIKAKIKFREKDESTSRDVVMMFVIFVLSQKCHFRPGRTSNGSTS